MDKVQTGYVPEFGLGAVYAGNNAADTQLNNQMELIKQFLANQREQQMQPLDVDIRSLEAARARNMATPEMLQGFVNKEKAGYNKAQREEEIANLLQPFKVKAAPLQGEQEVATASNNANLLELQKTLSTGVDRNGQQISPQDMQVLQQEYQKQIALRGETPELYGKTKLEDVKGEWDLKKQQLANDAMLEAARLRTSNLTGGGDKLKTTWMKLPPEVRMGHIKGALTTDTDPITGEKLTPSGRMYLEQQYEQDRAIINARVNARNQGAVTIEGGEIKPVTPVDVGGSGNTSVDLQTAIANELKRRQQEKGK